MSEKKLQVAALCNGTVIDHLPANRLFKAVRLLGLEDYDGQLTIGNNLESAAMQRKGIIKISDRFLSEEESNKLALIAPLARVNIIRNYEVAEKRALTLPSDISDIVRCPNPKCITNHQPVSTRFHVTDEDGTVMLRCHYCEKQTRREDAELK